MSLPIARHIARSLRSSSAHPAAHPTDRSSNHTFIPFVGGPPDGLPGVFPAGLLVCPPPLFWAARLTAHQVAHRRQLNTALGGSFYCSTAGLQLYYSPDPLFVPLVGGLPNGCPTDSFSAPPPEFPAGSFRSTMICITACPTVLLGERRPKSLFRWYWLNFSVSFQWIHSRIILTGSLDIRVRYCGSLVLPSPSPQASHLL